MFCNLIESDRLQVAPTKKCQCGKKNASTLIFGDGDCRSITDDEYFGTNTSQIDSKHYGKDGHEMKYVMTIVIIINHQNMKLKVVNQKKQKQQKMYLNY